MFGSPGPRYPYRFNIRSNENENSLTGASVEDLIGLLQSLQVRQAHVVQELASRSGVGPSPHRVLDDQPPSRPAKNPNVFAVGDRVRITNRIRRPLGPPVTTKDYVGVISRITPQRLVITCDSGFTIYRSPNNAAHHE